jgi:hypothetical protein
MSQPANVLLKPAGGQVPAAKQHSFLPTWDRFAMCEN